MTTKKWTLNITLDQHVVKAIDAWSKRNLRQASRVLAIQKLIQLGLNQENRRYSDADINQFTLQARQFAREGRFAEQKMLEIGVAGLNRGLEWAMDYALQKDYKPEPSSNVAIVMETLEMWDAVEQAFEQLGFVDKEYVLEKTPGEVALLHRGRPIRERAVSFRGFSEINEQELVEVARFLVDTAGLYPRFKGRNLAIDVKEITQKNDRKKVVLFQKIRTEHPDRLLSAVEVRKIALERVGPPGDEVAALLAQMHLRVRGW